MKPAAFYEQEAAVCSFISALSNAEIHYSLSISAPPSPSLSLHPLNVQHGRDTTHLQVNYTFCWDLYESVYVCVRVSKNRKAGVRGKECSCHHSFLFFSL